MNASALFPNMERRRWPPANTIIVDRAGLPVDVSGRIWRLNSSSGVKAINWDSVSLPEGQILDAFRCFIAHQIVRSSPWTTYNTFKRVLHLLHTPAAITAAVEGSTLPYLAFSEARANLGVERSYLLHEGRMMYRWCRRQRFEPFTTEVEDRLNDLVIGGNSKGRAVRSQDPTEGPLTTQEVANVITALKAARLEGTIPLAEQAALVLCLATGSNASQYAALREEDLLPVEVDGVTTCYILKVPRHKKDEERLRTTFRQRKLNTFFGGVIADLCKQNRATPHPGDNFSRPLFRRDSPAHLRGNIEDEWLYHLSYTEFTLLLQSAIRRLRVLGRDGNPQAPGSMQAAKRYDHVAGLDGDFFQDLNAVVGNGYNDAIMRFGREQRPDGSVATNIVSSEMMLALYASTFWRSFRNVIAIDPDLMALLEQTSADDLPLAAIRYPFPFFHVAFPVGNGMSLPGPANEIDGVYVDTRMEGLLQICITCRRLDRTPTKRNYPRVVERTFALAGEIAPDDTVGEFVRRLTEEKVAGLLASHDIWNGIANAMNEGEHGHAGGRHFTSVAGENNARRADDAEEGMPSALKALAIVMSVLGYLSTDHGTVTDYSPAPPQRLAQKLRTGTEKQRRQAREDAFKLGIIPIQVVGRGILSDEERGMITDREVRPHWRRGHIRRVWMDGGRERYEVRWIRPVIVNRHKGDPVGTHVHTVVTASRSGSGPA